VVVLVAVVLVVGAAAVHDQVGDLPGGGQAPARRLGGLAQLLGQRAPTADHHEPAAGGLRRVEVGRPVLPALGVLVPAAAGLAPVVAGGDLAGGQHRGPPARL